MFVCNAEERSSADEFKEKGSELSKWAVMDGPCLSQ
jgi:hypothetical protein